MKKITTLASLLLLPFHNAAVQPVEIHIDRNAASLGQVSPYLLGVNNPMTRLPDRVGLDVHTGLPPETFLGTVRQTGLRCFRFPAGNGSGSYFWQNGLGPVQSRPGGFDGSSGQPVQTYYHFGFLEFIEFIREMNAPNAVVCINFGTASAADASAWVEFANAEPGTDPNQDGVDHGALRAGLGYPDPFHIRYWEIGNELGDPYKHMFSWHFGQRPDGSENYSATVRNYLFGGDQWQYQDMAGRYEGQCVVRENNWTANAALSTGQPGQTVYVKFPPVDADSFSLALCTDSTWGTEWKQTGDLDAASPESRVFALNPETGEITFGDGEHGAVPEPGQVIRVKYKAIGQDGLADFSHAMRMADPSVQIGVPFTDDTFYSEVHAAGFESLPFDFVVDHPYDSGQDIPVELEHWRIHALADRHVQRLQEHREKLDLLSGQKNGIGIWISEYNLVYRLSGRSGETTNPYDGDTRLDYFGRSLDQGLYVAGSLMNMLKTAPQAGLLGLNIHALVSDSETALADWPVTGMIGPSPSHVLNPSALVYAEITQSCGYRILETGIADNPVFALPVDDFDPEGRQGWAADTLAVPYLSTLAAISPRSDTLRLYVLNRASGIEKTAEDWNDITAVLVQDYLPDAGHMTVDEINGPAIWSVNNSERQDVSTTNHYSGACQSPFIHTYRAHSLTTIMWTSQDPSAVVEQYAPLCRVISVSPNPLNASAMIRFELENRAIVRLDVYNLRGQRLQTLIRETMPAGAHQMVWNGTILASGLYLMQLKVNGCIQQYKCLILK
ncbi:T9SS type A sorting domain-containing protein [bacterium]|nr:T9SS type A sorting domain-containing protein [bacterium]